MATLTLVIGWTLCGFIILLALAIVWRIVDGKIDLSRLISEPNGDASMSRFQLLIFTFVIALSLFLVIVGDGSAPPAFPAVIPGGILALLGISGSSFLVSKGIQFSAAEGVEDRPPHVTVTPGSLKVTAPGQKQQFTATVIRATNTDVTWSLHPDRPASEVGTIDPSSGLYTAPNTLPTPTTLVTVKATSAADASAFGVASITF
jgi:hypothetical protein